MRNLLQLLWKNNYLILFLILVGISLYMLFQLQYYQHGVFINSSNKAVGDFQTRVNNVKQYFALNEKNKVIAEQNVLLLNRDSSFRFLLNTVKDTSHNDELLQQYVFTMATVINNSVHKSKNYITLNKGLLNGIQSDMGVVGPQGIVGVVKDVSPHYCTVMSLLHNEWRLNGKLKKTGEFGTVVWDGKPGYANLLDIPTSAQVKIGDTIVSTSFSPIFPEGIHIGFVTGSKVQVASSTLTIEMKLATNFHTLSEVYIINNRLKAEQKALEHKTDSLNAD